jgi:glycosyltransferase involved in cell wall biosynthesis
MRTLVVATEYPWPRNSGSRRRLAATVEALRSSGPVDLFSAVSESRTDFEPPPPESGLDRVERVTIDDRPPGPADYLEALRQSWAPFELPRRSTASVSRALAVFRAGSAEPYDLVWYFQVRAWVLAGSPTERHSVVDIDDLEDEKILARLALPRPTHSWAARGRRAAARWWTEEDARRWRRLHHRIAERVGATVLCSDLDAERSGLPGVQVIVNGYPPPDTPVGRATVSSPPVVTFQGTLRYPPNADAARFLATDIGPRLRALVPDARIRLVGLAPPAISDLDDPPTVTLTGQVPDITDELARADVIVIPVRYGSGTRVKILEAFAHRIPVVSTTIGAEGLDVSDGVHLLVADGAEAVAAACARLLHDATLRHDLVEAAHSLYMERYRSDEVGHQVVALAHQVAGQ